MMACVSIPFPPGVAHSCANRATPRLAVVNFDANQLLLGMLYSTIGLGMFIYGKKQGAFMPLFAGIGLMVVPMLISSLLWMSVVSLGLMASPFVMARLE